MDPIEQTAVADDRTLSLLKLTIIFVMLVLTLVLITQIYHDEKPTPTPTPLTANLLDINVPLQARFSETIVNAYNKARHISPLSVTIPLREASIPDLLTEQHAWMAVMIKPKTTLGNIFTEMQLDKSDLQVILSLEDVKQYLQELKPNHEIHLKIENNKLIELTYNIDDKKNLLVTRQNNIFKASINTSPLITRVQHVKGIFNHSLPLTLQMSGIPEKTLAELAYLFSWHIDYTTGEQQDTQFNVIYKEYDLGEDKIRTGDILAAELITPSGELHQAYRFVDSTGKAHYYTSEGNSLEKQFLRYPLHFTHISSSFSLLGRYHPILHIVRPHVGIDLAAPIGTPIYSIADGLITYQGNKGGYGNVVIIDHGHGYTSLYAHLSRFNNAQDLNSIVKKGEVIGYVGESGFATGPHCHYEFRINGIHYDPSTVELPAGKPLSTQQKLLFTQEVIKLQTLLNDNKSILNKSMLAEE